MRELYELFLTYVRGIWRYRWIMMLVAWLVSVVGWGVVYQLPDKYESSARVHVDTQSMLAPLLKGLTRRMYGRVLSAAPGLSRVMAAP